MASNRSKKDKSSTPPPAMEETNGSAVEVTDAAQDAVVEHDTPSQITTEKLGLRTLFAAYEEKDAALTRAKREFDLAAHERSQAVKAIYNSSNPPTKGPFRYHGNVVTIVARRTAAVGEGAESVTYFFKGQRQDVMDVD